MTNKLNKHTKKGFDDFVEKIVKAKPSKNLKGKDYNPTKKELEQKFVYARQQK